MLYLQVEIEKYRVENVTAEDVRHKNMSQLDQRLTETREQADWYQHKHDAALKRVDQLKVSLASCIATAQAPRVVQLVAESVLCGRASAMCSSRQSGLVVILTGTR